MIAEVVTIVCVGSRKKPHLRHRYIVDRFAPGGNDVWIVQDHVSRRPKPVDGFRIEPMPSSRPSSARTQISLDSGRHVDTESVSMADFLGMASGALETRDRYVLRCGYQTCSVNVQVGRGEALTLFFATLDEVARGRHDTPLGERCITLEWLGSILALGASRA